jgi:hypothetical protein
MPHYFMHLRGSSDEVLDSEGVRMPKEDLARAALSAARDCMAHDLRAGRLGAVDRPAPRNAAAPFKPHDADAVALVAAEDLVAGQIRPDVEADVSAVGAIEHEDGTRRQVRAPPRPVLRAHRDRRGGDAVFGKARRNEKDIPRSWFPGPPGRKAAVVLRELRLRRRH